MALRARKVSGAFEKRAPGFQKMEACFLLVNLRERNAELEGAAVSGEDRFVTTPITAAKETSSENVVILLFIISLCYRERFK